MNRVIEITGIAGVGKSYIIDALIAKNSNIVLDTEIIEKYKLSDYYLFYLFFKSDNSFRILALIIKIAYELNMRLYDRINFIRNSIKKVGKDYFLTYKYIENKIILVDEGVSHLYQNIIGTEKQNDLYILLLVNRLISNMTLSIEVLIVDASSKIIIERLYSRGHERLKTLAEIIIFVEKSKKHILEMKKNFVNIIEIHNENSIKREDENV